MNNGGPLQGIRVIELSTVVMGPWAAHVMADLGADVIKIEAPDGDIMRRTPPERHAGMGAVFLTMNRGKRSVVLDLKTPHGRDALLALCRTADVFLHNVRREAMRRLALDYGAVVAANPRIVYVSLVGYAQDGPYARRAAYDDLIQGACGLASLFERAGGDAPRYVPTLTVDRTVGISAVNAVLAALLYRERTGEGQAVDVPMYETMVELMLSDHLGGANFVPKNAPMGYQRILTPDRRPYRTSDGWVCVLLYNEAHWERFFAVAGAAERFAADERLSNRDVRRNHYDYAYGVIAELVAARSSREWLALLEAHDVPVMPLHDLESLLEDPHLVATGFIRERDHPTEGRIRSTAIPTNWSRSKPAEPGVTPALGEHTEEVLRELGIG
ncbi:MAG: CaiB/BaiF CoA transferase family protein [Candidatus Velthaea sp.]